MGRTTREVPCIACDGIACDATELVGPGEQVPCPSGWLYYRGIDPGPEGTDNDLFYCYSCAKRMLHPDTPRRRTHEPELDPSELSTVPGLTIR